MDNQERVLSAIGTIGTAGRELQNSFNAYRFETEVLYQKIAAIDEYARWVAVDIVNGKYVMPFEIWFETYKEKDYA